jgi:hypothetical protein
MVFWFAKSFTNVRRGRLAGAARWRRTPVPKAKLTRGLLWGGTTLLLVLALGWPALGAGAGPLSPREEAALFSLADLGPVDLSVKTVSVEVYVSPSPELDDCRRMLAQVWVQVQAFYARLGVNLVYLPGKPEAGPLEPARHLRLEFLADKEWLNKSYKAFNVAPPFRLRFLQVCLNKCAFAHLPLSVVHISFKRFKDAEFSTEPGKAGLNQNWLANLLTHELGHLLGLYHYHEFTDDPVARAPGQRGLPNFMGQKITVKPELGFSEVQRRLIHSYLSGGKVYQQYRQVDFDPLRYLELVKLHNNFHEPVPKVGKMARQVVDQGKIKTFEGEDDEDGDDD